MAIDPAAQRAILVLADDSANWIVAGVRQLDRLALAANEFAIATGERIALCIFWNADRPTKDRWFPRDARLTNCVAIETSDFAERDYDAILTTQLFIGRAAFGDVLAGLRRTDSVRTIEPQGIHLFVTQFATRVRAMQTSKWWYLDGASEADAATIHFLQTSGKPTDGIVSRLFNRHLSRVITQWLLPLHIRPTTFTLAGLIFPFAGFLCLIEGSRPAQICGAVLFQVYSILAGCDGELARAKYRETARGKWVDACSGALAMALLVIGTGTGLFRGDDGQSVSLAEGLLAGVLVFIIQFVGARKISIPARPSVHRTTVFGSDAGLLRRSALGAVRQLADPDVIYVVFLLLVLLGKPVWFLHAITISMIVWLAMTMNARRSRTSDDTL